MLTVAEIMTREPYTLGPDDSLATARELLAEHHIRHIPIVSAQDHLIGLVSQRDVLAAADSSVLTPDGESSVEGCVALSAIMTSPVQTADESASLRGAAMHLQKNKLGCLPVLRQKHTGWHYHRLRLCGDCYKPDGAAGIVGAG